MVTGRVKIIQARRHGWANSGCGEAEPASEIQGQLLLLVGQGSQLLAVHVRDDM